jgi:hypothetical protein
MTEHVTGRPPPGRRTGPEGTTPQGRSTSAAQTTDTQTVPRPADEPDRIEAAHPGFRAWQSGWRRRIRCSRRLAPLGNGVVDPAAPSGRWGE